MKEFLTTNKGNTDFVQERNNRKVSYSGKTGLEDHIAFQRKIGGPTTGWVKVKEPTPKTLSEEYQFAAEMLQNK